ncbi:hypothetical protein B0A52_09649 [Exophiala mesophila]|uniref:Zn(2)-C6 fungal-type domain-containing protein n=1 Tax=Exophiala mesophila TaxID=212818 RepID=A0A438MTY8_EXOME|nr:hypothetical protein B0A52_09649 [Exophiala mesophila]
MAPLRPLGFSNSPLDNDTQPATSMPPPPQPDPSREPSLPLLAPRNPPKHDEDVSARKQSKSRNGIATHATLSLHHTTLNLPSSPPNSLTRSSSGCITCKSRRMKCDETKPFCQQCARRKVTCGGYPKLFRWKPMGQGKNGPTETQGSQPIDTPMTSDSQPGQTSDPHIPRSQFHTSDNDLNKLPLITESPEIQGPHHDSMPPPLHHPPLMIPPFRAMNPSHLPPDSIESGSTDLSPGSIFGSFTSTIFDLQQQDLPDLDDLSSENNVQLAQLGHILSDVIPYPEGRSTADLAYSLEQSRFNAVSETFRQRWSIDASSEPFFRPPETSQQRPGSQWSGAALSPSIEAVIDALARSPAPATPSDQQGVRTMVDVSSSQKEEPETMRYLFEHQTCTILSIKDDHTKSPWVTLIWPMAAGYPALYHALAAMTCFQLCKTQPQFRGSGLHHVRSSMQNLAHGFKDDVAGLEAMIATRLALAFAQAWDPQKTTNGIDHINDAKSLIQEAASQHRHRRTTPANLSRLSFLANTCMYMDVIARLNCSEQNTANNLAFVNACSALSSHVPGFQQLDPLMGCAITLFPLMGRLAELVGRVLMRPGKQNSPPIISTAAELRTAIDLWTPSIEAESAVDYQANVTDAIQTAEAYRWATLLLLRQAVPELPWSHSILELAQKALIFLATVPLTSRTSITHIFPLLQAGCETTDEDDRDWVRERWDLMSARMYTGIVDRCREVTMEVWRRRDDYLARHPGILQTMATAKVGVLRRHDIPRSQNDDGQSLNVDSKATSPPNDFPDSAAFKKGVDPLTRAGFINYTVKGDLHWLSVMKEWQWEVMLG